MNAARKAAAMLPIGRLPALTPAAPVDPDAHVDSAHVQGTADAYHGAVADPLVPPHVARNGGRLVYRDVHPDGSQHAMYVYDGTPPPKSAG